VGWIPCCSSHPLAPAPVCGHWEAFLSLTVFLPSLPHSIPTQAETWTGREGDNSTDGKAKKACVPGG
jgi:hypothetical protein